MKPVAALTTMVHAVETENAVVRMDTNAMSPLARARLSTYLQFIERRLRNQAACSTFIAQMVVIVTTGRRVAHTYTGAILAAFTPTEAAAPEALLVVHLVTYAAVRIAMPTKRISHS